MAVPSSSSPSAASMYLQQGTSRWLTPWQLLLLLLHVIMACLISTTHHTCCWTLSVGSRIRNSQQLTHAHVGCARSVTCNQHPTYVSFFLSRLCTIVLSAALCPPVLHVSRQLVVCCAVCCPHQQLSRRTNRRGVQLGVHRTIGLVNKIQHTGHCSLVLQQQQQQQRWESQCGTTAAVQTEPNRSRKRRLHHGKLLQAGAMHQGGQKPRWFK